MNNSSTTTDTLFFPHINSYNTFISTLPSITSSLPSISIKHNNTHLKITFTSLIIHKPQYNETESLSINNSIYPYECTHRNMTYKGRIVCMYDVVVNGDVYTHSLECGYIPVMVGSTLCHQTVKNITFNNRGILESSRLEGVINKGTSVKGVNNSTNKQQGVNIKSSKQKGVNTNTVNNTPYTSPGGYFIINGHQKIIRLLITQKRNFWFAYKKSSNKKKSPLFTDACVTSRTVNNEIGHTLSLHFQKDGNIMLRTYFNKNEIYLPVIPIIRSLYNVTDKEIYYFVVKGTKTETSLVKGVTQLLGNNTCYSQQQCISLLQSLTRVNIHSILNILCSHVSDYKSKYLYLLLGIKKLLMLVSNDIQPDDPDSPSNHEILSASNMLCSIVRDKFEEMVKNIRYVCYTLDNTCVEEGTWGNEGVNMESDGLEGVKGVNDNSNELKGVNNKEYSDEGVNNSTNTQQGVTNRGSKQQGVSDKSSKQQGARRKGLVFKSGVELVTYIMSCIDTNIGSKIERFISTGNARLSYSSDILQSSGFSIYAENINFMRYISHFRSINRGAFFTTLKTTTVRKLRAESWGFMCPVHTPDGTPCGLIMHMCVECCVGGKEDVDVNDIYSMGVVPIDIEYTEGMEGVSDKGSDVKGVNDSSNKQQGVIHTQVNNTFTYVVMDGVIIGYTLYPVLVTNNIRKYRCYNNLTIEVTHHPYNNFPIINICTTNNRLIRPVYNNTHEKIDYIGIMEQPFMDIKLYKGGVINNCSELEGVTDKRTNTKGVNINSTKLEGDKISNTLHGVNTHHNNNIIYSELHPCYFLSLTAALTPFSDFNQSPRNMYQCQMAKQSMGWPCYDLNDRSDSKIYLLSYNQIPIVQNKFYSKYILSDYPTGINCIVSVLSYTGYDMEDAMVLNKNSVERGLFNGYIYRNDIIEYKDTIILPSIGQVLQYGSEYYYTDKQYYYKNNEKSIVHNVRIYDKGCVITLRVVRNPNIGDKFCSRHGQKGVMSYLYDSVDMVFMESGGTPDLIINPHAFPSRMSIGMLIESMSGKSGCLRGKIEDGTPFQWWEKGGVNNSGSKLAALEGVSDSDSKQNGVIDSARKQQVFNNSTNTNPDENTAVSYFGNVLKEYGYNYYGTEYMYSGITGKLLKGEVYTGVVYYQRLRHMVSDKFQVRSLGPVQSQTRQPVGGRKRMGGIRLGEMERDALIAHGVSYLLYDRMMDCSDGTLLYWCCCCKSVMFAFSSVCECGCYSIREVKMPFVFKYLCSELLAMNIRVKVEV